MDRRTACLAAASACRAEADCDPARRDQWLRQAEKWAALAAEEAGGIAVSSHSNDVEQDRANLTQSFEGQLAGK